MPTNARIRSHIDILVIFNGGQQKHVAHPTGLTESQIRPLTKLEPEQQQQVWEKVIEAAPVIQDKPKVTAKLVEEAVSQVTGRARISRKSRQESRHT